MRILFACVWLFWAGAVSAAPVVLVYGDSLSAAYGIPREAGWVALLERRLAGHEPAWQVVNASVSGETTAGGRTRLPAVLARTRPDLVILALGANDGLRGLPLAQTARNLEAMAASAKGQGARVLLVGMRLPPNYGRTYSDEFQAMFQTVSRRARLPLVPFLLEGIAARPELFQPDGLHPTAAAQPQLLDNVWRRLGPMLVSAEARLPANSDRAVRSNN
jgi:acyl-CoA thioesterase-1